MDEIIIEIRAHTGYDSVEDTVCTKWVVLILFDNIEVNLVKVNFVFSFYGYILALTVSKGARWLGFVVCTMEAAINFEGTEGGFIFAVDGVPIVWFQWVYGFYILRYDMYKSNSGSPGVGYVRNINRSTITNKTYYRCLSQKAWQLDPPSSRICVIHDMVEFRLGRFIILILSYGAYLGWGISHSLVI